MRTLKKNKTLRLFFLGLILFQSINAWSEEERQESLWQKAWGYPTPPILYVGMLTAHLNPDSNSNNWNNQTIAFAMKGYFAGTLLNSYHDRAYVGGIQRYWLHQTLSSHWQADLGYRLGWISGYDEKLSPAVENIPLLPFFQAMYDLTWNDHFGVEISTTGVIISAGLYYEF